MKITANFHDLGHIATLLGDHGYLPKTQVVIYYDIEAPIAIIIRKNTTEVAELLEKYKKSRDYPYTTYTISETTVGKRRKAQRGKRSDGQGSSSL